MKVLIGCEESQAVCKAFRELGHEAYSCDLKPCSGDHPEWHFQMDVLVALDGGILTLESGDVVNIDGWDMAGLHPVCTKMALSGNRHYAPGKAKHAERLESVEWTVNLWNSANNKCDRVYMENPMGAMNKDKRGKGRRRKKKEVALLRRKKTRKRKGEEAQHRAVPQASEASDSSY